MKFNSLKKTCLLFIGSLLLAIGAQAQTFDATPQAGKYYVIKNDWGNGVLSNMNNPDNNARIFLNKYEAGGNDQIWELRALSKAEPNVYVLVNPFYRKAIDLALQNWSLPLLQWGPTMNENQQIMLIPVTGQDHVYQIKSKHQNAYFTVPDNGGPLQKSNNMNGPQTYFSFMEVEKPYMPNYDWQDQTVFRINNEPPHASLTPYTSVEEWEADGVRNWSTPWEDPKSSTWLSLNGQWKLKWQPSTTQLPGKEFYGNEVNTDNWNVINVPSCFEMNGYGDPLYINVEYAFHDNPPYINMKQGLVNSTASMRRNFEVPTTWNGKRIVLHFDGIYGASNIWVNGHYVGYTQEANNVSEFDVTPYVHVGENNISIQIIRWSDSSYLEGQDMWHMSGIHRDVYLYATPQTYIQDYLIKDNIGPLSNLAKTTIDLKIANRGKKATQATIKIDLFDTEHQKLVSSTQKVEFLAGDSLKEIQHTFGDLRVNRWSPETPHLYTIRFNITDENGQQETFSTKYGFRHITIKNNTLYINGKRARLFGVNTQDTHPLYGRAIDKATMLKDIQMMKQANMNILRTSHYPRQPKMMDMLDAYGLFVVDEADLECHKNWDDHMNGNGSISNDPTWLPQMTDRVIQLVMRDRNHPSVLFWSLGNESAGGENFRIIHDSVKKLDPTRLVHYEGSTRARTEGTDIWSVMYPTLNDIQRNANGNYRNQPYFMCEYAHAMGNAVGNLKEYVDAIKSSKYGIGGCIWDWVDQTIYDAKDIKNGTLTVNGHPKFISGWDKPGPHQGNFVNNGIITGDRKWTAKLDEVKKAYQQVDFTKQDNHHIAIKNNYDQLKLNYFNFAYALLENGDTIQHGTIDISQPIRNNQSITMTIPTFKKPFDADKEYLLNVSLQLKKDELWAKKGYNLATEQFVLQNRPKQLPAVANNGKKLSIKKVADQLVVKTDSMQMTFLKDKGLVQWHVLGTPVIADNQGPQFSHYRFVENDGVNDNYAPNNGMNRHDWSYSVTPDSTQMTITFNNEGNRANTKYVYTLYANGVVDFDATFDVKTHGLRRIGMGMQFNNAFQNVDYYACGPNSNYVDRNDGSYLGHYQTTVQQMLDSYAKPQSTGNRLNLRFLRLSDNTGKGILIETEGQVAFSTLPYSDSELRAERHMWNLYPSNKIYAHFDYWQQGLGNATCGPRTLDGYMCPSYGTFSYKLRFSPLQLVHDGIATPTTFKGMANDSIYNLSGQKLTTPTQGVNVINGKKIMMK